MMMIDWLPDTFLLLVFAHFVALLSPGPDFFLVIGCAIRDGLKGSAFICLGIALGNGVYITLAIVGWHGLRVYDQLFSIIAVMGAIYLLYLGIMLLSSKPRSLTITATLDCRMSPFKQLSLGLGSALLNPKNALFYMSLMTVILGNKVSLLQQTLCGVWMFCAVLIWDLFIAAIISLPLLQRYLTNKVHWIERGAGAVLFSMGAGLLFRWL